MSSTDSRPLGIYLLIAWMTINVLLFLILIPGDAADVNNYIEVILWTTAIASLLTMHKAGAAYTISVLCITLSTSMGIILLAYYEGMLTEPVGYINVLRIIVNIAAVVYLFKLVFANKFR